MRSRRSAHPEVAEVARRRLERLSAELAGIRPDDQADNSTGSAPGGPGEPPSEASSGTGGSTAPAPAGRHARRSVGVAASLGGWVHDRVPATLQGRVRLSSAHLTLLALLVAAVVGATAWWVTRAQDTGTALAPLTASPTEPPTSTGSPHSSPSALASLTGTGPSASAAPDTVPSGVVVVDVAGKVRRPGIVTLPPGSRVVDALEAAGGARRGVHTGMLNLARVLGDGEQVVVGVAAPPGIAASAASVPTGAGSATPMVNVNTGSQAQLEELPGVGPVTAQAIMTFRSENGAFTSVDALLEVSGIGEATLAKIAPFVTL